MKGLLYRELFVNRITLLCRRKKIPFFSFLLPLLVMGMINIAMNSLPAVNTAELIELGVMREKEEPLPECLLDTSRFHIVYGTGEELAGLLKERKIAGYLVLGRSPEFHVGEMGREQILVKGLLDSMQNNSAGQWADNGYTYAVDMTGSNVVPDNRHLAFLYITTLICLLGARWGFQEMKELMPAESYLGRKYKVSPVSGRKLLILHMASVCVLHTACALGYSFIMLKTIGSPFKIRTELYLATVAIGSFGGIFTGALLCTLRRVNLKVKDVLLNIILLGMLSVAFLIPGALRFLISEKFPYLKIAALPVLITEMLYSLTIKEGFLLFLQDGLLLILYTAALGLWMFIRFQRSDE